MYNFASTLGTLWTRRYHQSVLCWLVASCCCNLPPVSVAVSSNPHRCMEISIHLSLLGRPLYISSMENWIESMHGNVQKSLILNNPRVLFNLLFAAVYLVGPPHHGNTRRTLVSLGWPPPTLSMEILYGTGDWIDGERRDAKITPALSKYYLDNGEIWKESYFMQPPCQTWRCWSVSRPPPVT